MNQIPDCQNQKSENQKSGIGKYLLPLLIVGVAAAYLSIVSAPFSVTGKPALDMFLLVAVVNFVLYLWVRLLSGWKVKMQTAVIAAVCCSQGLLLATVQMQGIQGNGRPVFAWRWSQLPADEFSAAENESHSVAIDLEPAWPQFRGPNRNGIAAVEISNWKTHPPKLMWKQPVGAGWSSFAVASEYCFTNEQRADKECLVCYRIRDGQQIWVNSHDERFSEISGGEGPRATPAIDNGKLYSLGATGILKCVEASNGQTVWETNILKSNDVTNCLFGMCGSPLVIGEKVIVSPGGKGCSLVAYDKTSGDLIWKGGDAKASYSSPVAMQLCGVPQILIFNGDGLSAHDLQSGRVLWHVDWVSNASEKNNVCQPIQLSDDEVFLSSAYGMGCARIRVSRDGDNWSTEFLWRNQNLKSKFSSAVLAGQHIFGLDLGVLVCLDAESGDRRWKRGRFGHGQFIQAGEFLVVQSEKGFVTQVAADPDQFNEIDRLQGLGHRTWTHPVIAGGVLLIRNDREMAAYQLK